MSKVSKKQRATQSFWTQAEDAHNISLVGSFNGWNPQATPMQRNEHGVWTVQMHLQPGRYEYKFVVDGEWRNQTGCDEPGHPGCPHCVPNEFGGRNCVILVP